MADYNDDFSVKPSFFTFYSSNYFIDRSSAKLWLWISKKEQATRPLLTSLDYVSLE